jgi:hypothetical protein
MAKPRGWRISAPIPLVDHQRHAAQHGRHDDRSAATEAGFANGRNRFEPAIALRPDGKIHETVRRNKFSN